jgi:TP901 family phage tail tape measure protein
MPFGVRPVKVPIVGVDKFSKTFGAIGKKLTGAGQKLTNVGSSMLRNVTLPVVGAGAAILATAGSFEASMNQVGVLTGAVGKDLGMLSDRARELGATTQFSASEAADAMTFLAMAGLNTRDVYDALPGTLELAAAAGTDLATAADIATNIMTPFGLKAEELTRINDTLANTFTATNTNMVQLAEGMKFVAPVASAMGIGLEETAAAMGLLGNAGIQGAMAGTTLRGVLSRLATPSQEAVKILQKLRIRKSDVLDSEGNVKSLTAVVQSFEKAGASAGDLLKVFGQRAGPGMAALVNQGTKALIEQTEANKKQGTASEVAKARMKGFFGQLKKLGSAAKEAAISIGEAGLLDAATKLAAGLTKLVQWLSALGAPTKNFVVLVAGIAAAIGPLLVAAGAISLAIAAITPPVAIAIGAIAGLIGITTAVVAHWTKVKSFFISLWDFTGKLFNTRIAQLLLHMNPFTVIPTLIINHWEKLREFFSNLFSGVKRLFSNFGNWIKSWGSGWEMPDWLSKTIDVASGAGKWLLGSDNGKAFYGPNVAAAERAAAEFGAGGNRTLTNNAEVDIRVMSEGVPVRVERKSGQNTRIQTDTGIAFAGG